MKASHRPRCGASWFDKLTMKRFPPVHSGSDAGANMVATTVSHRSRVSPRVTAAIRARRQRFYWWMLGPALAVLMVLTLAPTLFIMVASLTPLDLTRPDTIWNFARPLENYRLL